MKERAKNRIARAMLMTWAAVVGRDMFDIARRWLDIDARYPIGKRKATP